MADTLEQNVQMHTQPQQGVAAFEKPDMNGHILRVNFGVPSGSGDPLEKVWIKHGSMVASEGEVKFRRKNALHGVCMSLKKAVSGEGMKLTQASATGSAQLYLAHKSKAITVVRLEGNSISLNGNVVLAFEASLNPKIKMLKSVPAIVSGGLFHVHLNGHGCVAVLTEGPPITLQVGEGKPLVFTDPKATVAWSGDLLPKFKTDIPFKTFLGRGNGASFQMKFDGNEGPPGFILVEPKEEHGAISGKYRPSLKDPATPSVARARNLQHFTHFSSCFCW